MGDFYGFAKADEIIPRPNLEDYREEDGGYDYYGYGMAYDNWKSQFPDLYETWCPAGGPKEQIVVDPSVDALIAQLTA